MASVSSLDSDMRSLRLSKYTSSAANQVRAWIEETLGEKLPSGDLLDGLKDGVALCRLANLVLPAPGIKFKQSQMPFVQMENISHFLRACEMPPLSMPSHDRFLTVDLYENKDPAQVLQCLSAFSRVANSKDPSRFPTAIGGKRGGALSPVSTGVSGRNGTLGSIRGAQSMSSMKPSAAMPSARPISPTKTGGSATSSNADGLRSPGPISSWSKKTDQGSTAPAWNIHQYGYMGGASQGNQGISFGGRRQITTASPTVPSLAEKERRRKEKEAEEERLRQEAEEAERQRRLEREAEEERERVEEERKWEAETKRLREEERRRLDEQKRQWEEQERRWKAEEEARQREEAEMIKARPTSLADGRLNGQFLSQYQTDQTNGSPKQDEDTPEARRVKELEKQLEEARERERQYQLEREQRSRQEPPPLSQPARRIDSVDRPSSAKDSEASWAPDEREVLRQAAPQRSGPGSFRPLPTPASKPAEISTRPLPDPSRYQQKPEVTPQAPSPDVADDYTEAQLDNELEPPKQEDYSPKPSRAPAYPPKPRVLSRTMPVDETDYQSKPQAPNRTDQFLAQNRPPAFKRPATHQPAEMSSTLEEQSDRDRRVASQQATKAGGWASKSLLEREMERERERQKEWEVNQENTKNAARDTSQGTGANQSWSSAQYGFMGGDNQNRGSSTGSGIAMGGRRQIIGPRPQPGAR
ncbi:calponin homology (CH) domain-containing protein [Elsinoe australis]|uniref:Calponin homology (CH) domain-containing protein n=1 Tax=Elsinoe australis TaxID=40998 RepID=A0A4U7B5W7_9PEZI|nr:calponin homology (CH) domain-containing protein [Elsinoe australis]